MWNESCRSISAGNMIVTFSISMSTSDPSMELLASPFTMENGDIVLVQEIIGLHQNRVVISGSVNKPGSL